MPDNYIVLGNERFEIRYIVGEPCMVERRACCVFIRSVAKAEEPE